VNFTRIIWDPELRERVYSRASTRSETAMDCYRATVELAVAKQYLAPRLRALGVSWSELVRCALGRLLVEALGPGAAGLATLPGDDCGAVQEALRRAVRGV